MNELCMIIKDMVKPNFLNIKTSIQTYDRYAKWSNSNINRRISYVGIGNRKVC